MIPPVARSLLGIIAVFSLMGCSESSAPLSPEDGLKSLRISDDFRVELFAAEPYVVDPVELVFDERGQAFVAEMLDYPFDPPTGESPRGRIKLLEDRDGDGRIDHSTVFADNLLQVASLLPWNGGLLVPAAPEILYLKDTDGDGKADVRKVLFRGFRLAHPEGRITNLRFSVDNWIYAANSGQQGLITFLERPEAEPVSVLGADFRFRLDRGLFEAASGPTQYGLAVDAWGNRFSTHNSRHVSHAVMPRSYLTRNPFFTLTGLSEDISDHGERLFQLTPPEEWREKRTRIRQQRFRELQLDRKEEASGFFTAAAGGTIYGGDTLPENYRGNLFTGDVAGHLVHRDILRPRGGTFVASRDDSESGTEFLASTDPWFRPCNLANGPDGNLYVVDMYRQVVEGPEFIPDALKEDLDFYAGDDRGRIYRVLPKTSVLEQRSVPRKTDLGGASTSELVQLLSHANAWWRLTAQRLLLERQDRQAIPWLKETGLGSPVAETRLHSLYALEGLSGLDATLIRRLLGDPSPNVREHALRLAEEFHELQPHLLNMTDDPSARVRFQLALTLGQFPGPSTIQALASLLAGYRQDDWLRAAVLSSPTGSSVELLNALLKEEREPPTKKFLKEIGTIVGARNDRDEVSSLLGLMVSRNPLRNADHRTALLNGLSSGLKLAGVRGLRVPTADRALSSFLADSSESVQAAARAVAQHFELAQLISLSTQQALDPMLSTEKRGWAIRSLAGGRFQQLLPVFDQLLSAQQPSELLKETIQTLGLFDEPQAGTLLIERWKIFGPKIRRPAVDVLLSRRQHCQALLHAVQAGRIEDSALDLPHRMKLLENPSPEIRELATQVFGERESERSLVVTEHQVALDLPSSSRRGRELFEEHCASCHLRQQGKGVAPDLGRVKGKSKRELLEAILDPSSAVSPFYTNYVIMTKDGQMHDGLIVSETPGTLTMRRGEGEETALLRSQIVEIRASNVSLMPDGLEEDLKKQDLADVIAFLQGDDLLDQ